MPNTYYKYKERDADSQINWAQVGADVTKMLTDEAQSRESKKAAIDKATKESLEAMRNAPTGESVTLQEAAINYSDEVTQSMLNAERLLKSGVMKPRDYAIYQQNLNDGTEQAFGLYQEYQNVYAQKMERFQNGESSAGEVWMMENVEGYADLSQAKFTHDPVTGKVVAVGADGQPRSVASLKRQMTTNIDKYNVDGTTQDWVNMNGSWAEMSRTIGSRTRSGSITTSIDPTLKQLSEREIAELGLSPEDGESINLYMQAETDYVESIVNGPNAWQAASILTDHVGGYEFTQDKSKAGGNTILLVPNEQGGLMPELTDEQKQKAEGQLRIAIRNKIDKSEEVKTVNDWQRPTADQEARAGRDKDNQGIVGNIGKLYYGDNNDVKDAADFLRGLNPNIKSIDRTGTAVVIEYNDGSSENIPFQDNGQLKDQLGFIEGAANFLLPQGKQITNVRDLASRGGYANRPFNAQSSGFSAGTTTQQEPINETFSRVALQKSGLKPNMFVADDEDQTVSNIQSAVQSLPSLSGYTVSTSGIGNDEVTISDADGNAVLTFELDASEGFNAEKASQYIRQIIELSSNLTGIEDKGLYTQGQRGTTKVTPTRSGASGTQSNPNGVGSNY